MKLYTGLDIHKNTIYGTMMDESGRIVEQGEFVNGEEYLKNFLCGRPTSIVIEACGFYTNVYDMLVEMGYTVKVAHSTGVRMIASAKLKSDKIDSQILAHLLRTNLIPEAWVPPKPIREQRDLVRFRSQLIRSRTQSKNRIKAILLKKGLRFGRDCFVGRKRQELEALNDEKINAHLRVINALNEEVTHIDKKIKNINAQDAEAQLLQTIPGIGEYSARLILSEIGEINRFPSAKKLKSYAGIIPARYQSGGRDRHGSITKLGSAWLRWALVQCVHAAVRKDNSLSRFYLRLAQHKKKQVALTATAAKMLDIVFAVLRDKKPYHSPQEGQKGNPGLCVGL